MNTPDRLEELTLQLLEENLNETAAAELDGLIQGDPALEQKHLRLMELEGLLRGEDGDRDVTDAVLAQLEAARTRGAAAAGPERVAASGKAAVPAVQRKRWRNMAAAAAVLTAVTVSMYMAMNPSVAPVSAPSQPETAAVEEWGIQDDPGGSQHKATGSARRDILKRIETVPGEDTDPIIARINADDYQRLEVSGRKDLAADPVNESKAEYPDSLKSIDEVEVPGPAIPDTTGSPALKGDDWRIVFGVAGGNSGVFGHRGGGSKPRTIINRGNSETYEAAAENEAASPLNRPLSTFAIDVDTASYSNVRRFLNDSQLPPADAVRIEEMINYFDYDYPQPSGDNPFAIVAELAPCPWNPGNLLAHIGLQGRVMNAAERQPSNLVFLIDVSGSMNAPEKLPLLRQVFTLLVDELQPGDRVAIVTYSDRAQTVLKPTSVTYKQQIINAIDGLLAGGSTAGEYGLRLAYQVARSSFLEGGNNRIIAASDGDFNVGTSDDDELVRLITRERESGVFLTVLGFGTGNLKDARMEKIADKGNGQYAYIDSILEGKRVLVDQLGATLHTIAKDVKIQVEFNPLRVQSYRLVGYENRVMAAHDFHDDSKDAGELGAGHSVTALYEIVPVVEDGGDVEDQLRYQDRLPSHAARSDEIFTVKLRFKKPDEEQSRLLTQPIREMTVALSRTTDDFRFAAAVAEFALLLKQSPNREQATYRQVLDLAQGARGRDPQGDRMEFIRLVEAARAMAGVR